MDRRTFLTASGALPLACSLPAFPAPARTFEPAPGRWRTFEVVTRLDIDNASGTTQAWVPVPAVNARWQASGDAGWATNAVDARLLADPDSGARLVHARFADGERAPWIEVTSRIRTQDRAGELASRRTVDVDRKTLARCLEPTALMPLDGIVRRTATGIVKGRRSDVDKARALYDWVIANTWREPKVRGCGVGDIRAMLESGNLGGKCADINALFVGLARAVGIPARDVYGIRVAPSAFGYKELGVGSSSITRGQHCRAEVFLAGYGWVAMDPADVGKVMRQETSDWIKDPAHPIVAPVKRALFGGWEGNWIAYNTAHDVALPGSRGARIGFLMYPQAETDGERVDSLDPDTFRYRITAREIVA